MIRNWSGHWHDSETCAKPRLSPNDHCHCFVVFLSWFYSQFTSYFWREGVRLCNIRLPSETHLNTLRPRQNDRHFPDDIFKCISFNENVWIPIKSSLKFVPKGPINNIPALVQIKSWRRPGDKPLCELTVVSLPTHICVARPQWVKFKSHEISIFHNIRTIDHYQNHNNNKAQTLSCTVCSPKWHWTYGNLPNTCTEFVLEITLHSSTLKRSNKILTLNGDNNFISDSCHHLCWRADDLAAQRFRASAVILLIYFCPDNPFSASEGLIWMVPCHLVESTRIFQEQFIFRSDKTQASFSGCKLWMQFKYTYC